MAIPHGLYVQTVTETDALRQDSQKLMLLNVTQVYGSSLLKVHLMTVIGHVLLLAKVQDVLEKDYLCYEPL